MMKATDGKNKSLQGLENQKIDSENVKGGTKQSWSNENEKDYNSNSIPEGSIFKPKKTRRGGGLSPASSTDPK